MSRFALSNPLRWVERQLPIADKIGIPLAAIAVLTATALSLNSIAATRKQIDQSYKTQALQVANLVQANFSPHLPLDLADRSATSQFLQALKRHDPSILKIQIYRIIDQQPTLWAASESEPLPTDSDSLQLGKSSQIIDEQAAELETVVPLMIAGEPSASIAVYSSLSDRNTALTAATRSTILTSALGISAQSVALMLVLYWAVLRRMKHLSHAALRVADGDTSVRLPEQLIEAEVSSCRDEILNVTREFNRMLSALQRRSQQQHALG